ncbi:MULTISPECIES: universal stress protein [unclassified Caballeronia]|uniref:universal stress protein n=1 Tax=unclassified Caballeronia TaxID=2646786 RepID=UPI0020286179|nr:MULTISPECIES: universal stress protein [unclassified Caballeronia]
MEPITSSVQSCRPRRVLVSLDTSPASENALAYACKFLLPDMCVRLISVVEDPVVPLPLPERIPRSLHSVRLDLARSARDTLEHAQMVLAAAGHRADTELLQLSKQGGNVVHAIAEAAVSWRADLLIIGAHQYHGFLRWIEGSVAEPLVSNINRPLLIAPESFDATLANGLRRILFAVDGSTEVLPALRVGAAFATSETHSRAIYVIDKASRFDNPLPFALLDRTLMEEGKSAIAMARRVLDDVPGTKTTEIVSATQCGDDIAHMIVREANAWRADLVVMGTHGRRGAARWILGSVARRVARIACTPLLLVNSALR